MRRFPFWRTLLNAHASIVQNFGIAARVTLPPLLAYCAISASVSYWKFSPADSDSIVSLRGAVFDIVDEVAGVVLASAASIKWHRLLLLDELPSKSLLPAPRLLKSYMLIALLVWSATTIPFYAAAFSWQFWVNSTQQTKQESDVGDHAASTTHEATKATEQTTDPTDVDAGSAIRGVVVLTLWTLPIIAAALAAWAAISFLPLRLSLALPAIATGDEDRVLGRAWILTRGNFWRLYWGSVLSVVPAIVGGMISILSIDSTTRAGYVLDATILAGLLFACTLIWVGFLSHAYRALKPKTESQPA